MELVNLGTFVAAACSLDTNRTLLFLTHTRGYGGGLIPSGGAIYGQCRSITGKLIGKRPLGNPSRIWEDNNKMDL